MWSFSIQPLMKEPAENNQESNLLFPPSSRENVVFALQRSHHHSYLLVTQAVQLLIYATAMVWAYFCPTFALSLLQYLFSPLLPAASTEIVLILQSTFLPLSGWDKILLSRLEILSLIHHKGNSHPSPGNTNVIFQPTHFGNLDTRWPKTKPRTSPRHTSKHCISIHTTQDPFCEGKCGKQNTRSVIVTTHSTELPNTWSSSHRRVWSSNHSHAVSTWTNYFKCLFISLGNISVSALETHSAFMLVTQL